MDYSLKCGKLLKFMSLKIFLTIKNSFEILFLIAAGSPISYYLMYYTNIKDSKNRETPAWIVVLYILQTRLIWHHNAGKSKSLSQISSC